VADTDDGAWRTYLQWNKAIAEEVFPVGLDSYPVYLQLDSGIISKIAETFGQSSGEINSLRSAVRCTLDLKDGRGVLARHARETHAWQSKLTEQPPPPPCIGLLSIFVMAAENMHGTAGVGANNYYDRLMEEFGLPSALATSLRNHFAAQFRTYSLTFWDALNTWLRAWRGRRGTPTATQVGGYTYVGVPISQALVRVHDRRHLRELFATRGYQPDSPPERSRLVRDLDKWINQTGSPASNALRELWHRGQSETIADIVEQEIRSWPGQTPGQPSARGSARIRVALALRRRGLQSLPGLLLLTEAAESQEEKDNISLRTTDKPGTGDEAWSPRNLRLKRISLPGWYSLEPTEELLEGIGLLRKIDLEDPESGRRYNRASQSVIVLKWEPEQDLYLEVDQMKIDERYAVLCERDYADQVGTLLNAVTNGVASAWAGPQDEIPEDWQLFLQVIPLQADVPAEVDIGDLALLVPEPQYFFKVDGGISLPGEKTWHLVMPPEIAAFTDDGERSIELSAAIRPLSHLADSTSHLLAESPGGAHVRLREQSDWLAECDLNIEFFVYEDDWESKVVRRTVIRLRSGNSPRHLSARESRPIAMGLHPEKEMEAVTGMDLREKDPDGTVVTGASIYVESDLALSSHPGHEGDLEVLPATPEQALRSRVATRMDGSFLDQYDTFLDALSYARAGSWNQFQKLARRINDAFYFPYQAAQALTSLGHIEVQLDPSSLRPMAWTIAPALLVVPPLGGGAFLCGFRSSVTLDALSAVVNELGGVVDVSALQGAPSKISVRGLSNDDLQFVAEYVSHETGVPLSIGHHAPRTLIEKGATLADIVQVLPKRGLHDDMEVFRPGSGRWSEDYLSNRTGAVRERRAPRRYGIVLEEDYENNYFRVADPQTARLAGMLIANPQRVTFDKERRKVTAPRQYPLLPLIERALVLCSGEPPKFEGNQRVYGHVPEDIGPQALASLWLNA